MEEYNIIQPHIRLEIKNALDVYSEKNKYNLSNIPVHEHSGKDTVPVVYSNLKDKKLYIIKSLDGTAPQTAGNYGVIFIAPFVCNITTVTEVHQVAGSDGGAVTLNVEKLTSGVALDSGVEVLNTSLSLKTTANIPQTGTLSITSSNLQLNKGDRLALKDAGALTALVGVCIIIEITY